MIAQILKGTKNTIVIPDLFPALESRTLAVALSTHVSCIPRIEISVYELGLFLPSRSLMCGKSRLLPSPRLGEKIALLSKL